MALKDKILATDDLPRTEVHVPEWDETVWVRAMTGSERDSYEADLLEKREQAKAAGSNKPLLKDMRAILVVLCTVDENGERLFDDSDLAAVGKKSANALNHIVEVAQTFNKLDDDEIEEIAGN